MSTCYIELAAFLKERTCKDTKDLGEHANKYFEAWETTQGCVQITQEENYII